MQIFEEVLFFFPSYIQHKNKQFDSLCQFVAGMLGEGECFFFFFRTTAVNSSSEFLFHLTGCCVSPKLVYQWGLIVLSLLRFQTTFGLSLTMWPVATGNQWSDPMKSKDTWFHWSAALVSCSYWSDRRTKSESGSRPEQLSGYYIFEVVLYGMCFYFCCRLLDAMHVWGLMVHTLLQFTVCYVSSVWCANIYRVLWSVKCQYLRVL